MPDDTPTERPDEGGRSAASTWGDDPTVVAPQVALVMYDDDVTPIDFALFLLQRYLGYEEPEARAHVQNVAEKGSHAVLKLPKPQAEILHERVSRAIRESGYPLKVTLAGADQS